MKSRNILAASLVVISGAAIADTYQTEIGVSAVRVTNKDIYSSGDSYGLDGRYYFNAVNTNNLPLAESAFLNKNSNVYAGYAHTNKTSTLPNFNSYYAGAEFYIPESFLYVNAGAVHDDLHGDNNWYTSIGVTPINGLLITTYYNHDDGYNANLNAKYVTAIGSGQFINLEAGVSDEDAGTRINLAGDFYFDNTFSVGAAIQNQGSMDTTTLRTRKFFTERFSGELSLTHIEGHQNLVQLGLAARF